MTDKMTWEKWMELTPRERVEQRAAPVPAQLAPYVGKRIEVVDHFGQTRRFWVGTSTGWCPAYLEIKLRTSTGGMACDSRGYASIKFIREGRYTSRFNN
jgi:hypothetical protein